MAFTAIQRTVTTDAAGAETVYFDNAGGAVSGYVHSIRLIDTDLTNTADLTFTADRTGEAILTELDGGATETWYPRVLESKGTDGSALATYTRTAVADDKIKLVVTGGGDTKSAVVHIVLAD